VGAPVRRITVLLAVGCATALAGGVAAPAKSPPTTHDVLPVFVSTGRSGVGVDFFSTSTSWGATKTHRSLARSLGVFARPARPSDVLPPVARAAFSAPGSPVAPEPARGRRLLARGSASIYAEPTRQGSVCYFLVGGGGGSGGSCVSELLDGALPQVTAGRVWGLTDNGAIAVDVRLPASGWLHASLGRNAFYLRLPHRVLAPTQIVVRERNGARHIYDVRRCRVTDLSPLSGMSPLSPSPC